MAAQPRLQVRLLKLVKYLRRHELGLPYNRPPLLFRCAGPPGRRRLVPCRRTRRCAAIFSIWREQGMGWGEVLRRSRKLRLRNVIGKRRCRWTMGSLCRLMQAWRALPPEEREPYEREVWERWPHLLELPLPAPGMVRQDMQSL